MKMTSFYIRIDDLQKWQLADKLWRLKIKPIKLYTDIVNWSIRSSWCISFARFLFKSFPKVSNFAYEDHFLQTFQSKKGLLKKLG